MNEIVNGLWISEQLSILEQLTILSFINNGYTFRLWTYTPNTITVPSGVFIRDAAEIIPQKDVFFYQNKNKFGHGKGSYAGFSDVFRYKLLYTYGGIWTDMDVTCIKKIKHTDDYFFRFHHKAGAVGNFMKCPEKSPLMLWCYEKAVQNVNKFNTDWMLPINILNEGIQKFKLEENIHKISNNDSFPEIAKLLTGNKPIPVEWCLIHWMNEEFRRLNISKNIAIVPSVYYTLLLKNNLKTEETTSSDLLSYRIKLNRFNYLWQHLKSRVLWYLPL